MRTVYVVSGGVSKFSKARPDKTFQAVVKEAYDYAIADIGLDFPTFTKMVDGSVASYFSDHFSRQLMAGIMAQDYLGLCPKPGHRVEGGGATGGICFQEAWKSVASGHMDVCVAYGFETMSHVETWKGNEFIALASDVSFDYPVGGFYSGYYAMMVTRHMKEFGTTVEQMRREGFELTVGKPQVVTREIDGKVHEPVERLTIDVPEDFLGVVSQLLALRKGRLEQMVNHGTGWVRMDFRVPARGLIGFRTEFLTETRGTGMLHHVFDGWMPWVGEIRTRPNGSMVADRTGVSTTYSLMSLQERGALLIGPGVDVYEGMVVGENSRPDEMDVNPTREKKLTNMRAAGSDDLVRLVPPRLLSLEAALEFISDDECVEVTPSNVRLRKTVLSASDRGRLRNSKRPPREG